MTHITTRSIGFVLGALLSALLSVLRPLPVYAHPLHTTLTGITFDHQRHTARAVLRVFMDDFGRAVAQHAHVRSPLDVTNGDALRYVAASFAISGPDSKPLPLSPCGMKRTGDLMWLCVEAVTPLGPDQLTVRDHVLCDLFDDQVNIVQVSLGADKRTILFTPGDGFKSLR